MFSRAGVQPFVVTKSVAKNVAITKGQAAVGPCDLLESPHIFKNAEGAAFDLFFTLPIENGRLFVCIQLKYTNGRSDECYDSDDIAEEYCKTQAALQGVPLRANDHWILVFVTNRSPLERNDDRPLQHYNELPAVDKNRKRPDTHRMPTVAELLAYSSNIVLIDCENFRNVFGLLADCPGLFFN